MNNNSSGLENRKSRTAALAVTAVMSAVICVLSPMSVPIGPIPLSFSVLAILLSVYLLGWKLGTLSLLVYLAIGMAGVPVFSNFRGGLSVLLGPTGGYLLGYIPMALIAGLVTERSSSRIVQALGMALGAAVMYAFGTAWYCLQGRVALGPALSLCVWPFIPFDLLKIICVVLIAPSIRQGLEKAGLLRP